MTRAGARAVAVLLSTSLVFLVASLSGWFQTNVNLYSSAPAKKFSIEADTAAVATDHPACSAIGVDVMKAGGNAVDAAVASAFCLGVVAPAASGIGGGAFVLIRLPNGTTLHINGRETAPAAAHKHMFDGREELMRKGPLSVAVPGEIAALHAAWSSFGSLPWQDLLSPAIKLAREGFMVSEYLASEIKMMADAILGDPGSASVFAPRGAPLLAGESCFRIGLASTLQAVADEGPEVFYSGRIGRALAADVVEAGGILTAQDIGNYSVDVQPTISADVFGLTFVTSPPPSSAAVLLETLKVLEKFPLPLSAAGPLGTHRLVEALKHAFGRRTRLGDPWFVRTENIIEDMLSDSLASFVRSRIVDNTTFPPAYYEPRVTEQPKDAGTAHLCVVDESRTVVSLTTTVNGPFGALFMSPSTGVLLNNEMADFSVPGGQQPYSPPPSEGNFVQPGKRPLSCMAPTVVLQNGLVMAVVGGSGGPFILSNTLQVLANLLLRGMGPQDAVLEPRLHHQLYPNTLFIESGHVLIDGRNISMPQETVAALQRRGHDVKLFPFSGAVQLIVQDFELPIPAARNRGEHPSQVRGRLTAVSDPRKDGVPAGY